MAIYVDFCFRIAAHHLVVVGWRYGDVLDQTFTVHDRGGVARATGRPDVSLHTRTDLPDPQAAGFVMIFRLDEAADTAEAESEAVWTLNASASGSIAMRYTGEDLSGFVVAVGDEPFHAVLAAIGSGRLPPVTGAAARALHGRVRPSEGPMLDAGDAAAAFDIALCDPSVSAGLCGGWALPGVGKPALAMSLLFLAPDRAGPCEAAFESIPRPDLAGFESRFAVDGRRGFLASASAGRIAGAPFFVLVLECGQGVHALARTAERVRFGRIAERFADAAIPLEPRTRARLRRALASVKRAPAEPGGPADTAPARREGAPHPGGPVLVLEHDGRPRDLREVLGTIALQLGDAGGAEGAGFGFDLVLPGHRDDGAIENALEGVARDHPGFAPRLCAEMTAVDLAACAAAGRDLFYLRASLLLQSDVLGWLTEDAAAGASIALWEEQAGRAVPSAPAALVAHIARRRLSFALALSGGPATGRLVAASDGLLSLGGAMLWAAGQLPAAEVRSRVLTDTVFLGDTPAGEVAIPGGGPVGFDMDTIAAHA